MDYRKKFLAQPGERCKLHKIDPDYTGQHVSKKEALPATEKYCRKLEKLQETLYAEKKRALLIVVQALDAGGKDGTINHVMGVLNPQGASVTSFKQPSADDLAHDFLWRIHPHAPAKGWIGVFNRSHYEDVLVARVHKLVSKDELAERYENINDFERLLRRQNNTHIVKFFLHISAAEQLRRFAERLDDPARNWKISESDYQEREYWDAYMAAYEEMFQKTSKKNSPWYIIPSNHKWFRNLAVSQILADTMEDLGMELPKPTVDLERIREQYHQAEDAGNEPSRHRNKSK
ncbi:MAG TPA: polyphosphate kinase 2 family protein [Candidatus Acidoferrales bacterium]